MAAAPRSRAEAADVGGEAVAGVPAQDVPATYLIAFAVGAHIVGMSTAHTPVLLARFLRDRSGLPRARLRDWLERLVAIAAVLLPVAGAILLAKSHVALG